MKIINVVLILGFTIIIGLYITHLYFVNKEINEMEHEEQRQNCPTNKYFSTRQGITIEETYHGIRAFLMLCLVIWLFVTSYQTFSIIKENTENSLFKSELRKILISYFLFAFMYFGWMIKYFTDLYKEFGVDNDGYRDQIQSLLFNAITFSCLPILILFIIHFYSYSSMYNIYKVA